MISAQKDKIPKGKRFVLRTSTLDAAMAAAGIELDTMLLHLNRREPPLECFFWPPNPRFPHERLYVRAGAVDSALAKEARSFVEQEGIPQLIVWVSTILKLSQNSPLRCTEQHFFIEFPRRTA